MNQTESEREAPPSAAIARNRATFRGGRPMKAGMSGLRRFNRRVNDRGATAVEYALGMALLVAVSIGGIQTLEDDSTDEFNDRADRSGAPDLAEVTDGGGSGGGTATSGTDGTTPTVTEVFFGGFSNVKATVKGKEWSAKLTVNVDDADGNVSGVRVDGSWTYTLGSNVETVGAVCNQTNGAGDCQFQLSDIPLGATEATFTMTNMSGGDPPVTYNGGPQTQVVVR